MSEEAKKRDLVRIGQIWNRKDNSGKQFIALGQDNGDGNPYNQTVEVTVRDAEGKVITQVTNPKLNLFEPRGNAALLHADVMLGLDTSDAPPAARPSNSFRTNRS